MFCSGTKGLDKFGSDYRMLLVYIRLLYLTNPNKLTNRKSLCLSQNTSAQISGLGL